MKSKEEVLNTLKSLKPELVKRFKLRKLALFGSYSRGDQKESSDVDIIVDVPPSIGLEFVSLAEIIEQSLGLQAHIVSLRAIKTKRLKIIEPDLNYV